MKIFSEANQTRGYKPGAGSSFQQGIDDRERNAVTNLLEPGVTITVDNTPFHMGYSRISQYLECPKKYKFTYVDNIRAKGSVAMRQGQAYHGTLEAMYSHKLDYGELMDIAICDKVAVRQSKKEGLTPSVTYKVIDAVRYYHAMLYADHDPLSVEDSFTITRGGVKLTGRIDLVTTAGRIVDHKFSYDTWADNRARYGVQPMIYQWAGLDWLPGHLAKQGLASIPYSGFQYNIIRLWPSALIQVIDIPVISQDESDWWEEQVAAIAASIKAGSFPANPSEKTCQYCAHKKLCKPTIYNVDTYNLGATKPEEDC